MVASEHLHISRAHIVGHSYGGSIALQFAVDFPTYVHTLVLLEAALTSVPRWQGVRALVNATSELYKQGDWEAAADPFLGSPTERATVAKSVPGALEQALRDLDTYFRIETPAHEAWRFTAAEGKRISQPVLFMLGSESQQFYVECRDQVQQWMPQTETVVLPGATHLLHMQQPAAAADLLADFFAWHPFAPRTQPLRQQRWRRDLYNAAADLLDGNLEAGRAQKIAIKTPTSELTFAEVAASANRVGIPCAHWAWRWRTACC